MLLVKIILNIEMKKIIQSRNEENNTQSFLLFKAEAFSNLKGN